MTIARSVKGDDDSADDADDDDDGGGADATDDEKDDDLHNDAGHAMTLSTTLYLYVKGREVYRKLAFSLLPAVYCARSNSSLVRT